MEWLIGLIGALFVAMLICIGSAPDKPKAIEYTSVDCQFIPEDKKDVIAKLMVECVNNATAKNTGENQDADDWVKACKEKITEIYLVNGHKLAVNEGWGDFHFATACHDFADTLTPAR